MTTLAIITFLVGILCFTVVGYLLNKCKCKEKHITNDDGHIIGIEIELGNKAYFFDIETLKKCRRY